MSDILDAPTLPCAHCNAPVMFGGMRHLKGEMVCRYCYEKAHEELPAAGEIRVAEDGLCYGCESKVPVDVLFEYQGQKFCPLCCDTLQSVVLRTGKEPAL